MNAKTGDRLGLLRAKYFDEIKVREEAIRTLREKLNLLDEVEADSRGIDVVPSTTGKYAKLKLTKAVLRAVQEIGGNGGVRAPDVRKYLEANGYQHVGKNFDVATFLALSRLSKRGKILSDKKEGKRVFMVKP